MIKKTYGLRAALTGMRHNAIQAIIALLMGTPIVTSADMTKTKLAYYVVYKHDH